MRIRFLIAAATPERAWRPGESADWPDEADALRLVAAGVAEPDGFDARALAASQTQLRPQHERKKSR